MDQPHHGRAAGVVLDYNYKSLEFTSFRKTQTVIFDSVVSKGYYSVKTSPDTNMPNAIKGLRTIEIDYDSYSNPGGIPVPSVKTYLGTLRFKMLNKGVLSFTWDTSRTSVHTVSNEIITGSGTFKAPAPILPFYARIVNPNGNEQIASGKKYRINWATDGTSVINIELSSNGGFTWSNINTDTVLLSDKSYLWTVPNVTSASCLIRLIDKDSHIALDTSDATFAIFPPYAIIYTPSQSDPVYAAGTQMDIIWSVMGYNLMQIEYSADSGATWIVALKHIDSQLGTCKWTVPPVTTKKAFMRFISEDDSSVIVKSSQFKMISHNLVFRSPKANDILRIGTKTKVTWKWSSDYFPFDLYLSNQSGSISKLIASNVNSLNSSLDWLVDPIGNGETEFAYMYATTIDDVSMVYGKTPLFIIAGIDGVDDGTVNANIINGIYVSPEPATSEAHVVIESQIDASADLDVYNLNGEVVAVQKHLPLSVGANSIPLNVSQYPSGVYIIIVKSNNFKSKNFVKSTLFKVLR